MAKVALADSQITESTVADHITYRITEQDGWNPAPCTGGYIDGVCQGWGNSTPNMVTRTKKTSAKINGTCTATVTNVKFNSKAPIVKGDKTKETDTYSLPSGGNSESGNHTNTTTGSVTGGNSKNVFVNGELVAISGSAITTHASNATTIGTTGLSTTVNIGA